MPNLHPPCSGLPLAFVGAVFLLELLLIRAEKPMLRHAATVSVVFALLAILAAYLSGYVATDSASQSFTVASETIEAHHDIGTWLLIVAVPWGIFYFVALMATHGRGIWRSISWVLLLAVLVLTLATGYRGGELVFVHGAGVAARPILSK